MRKADFETAQRVSMESARGSVVRSTLALGLIYAAFSISYLLGSSAGGTTLAIVTGISALGLIAVSLLTWNREVSTAQAHVWIFGLCFVILFNVNTALIVSGDYLFAISHLVVQLAAGALAPSLALFTAFVITNVVVCVVVIEVSAISTRWDHAALGFVMATAVACLVLLARFRNLALMEGLRQAVEESRDRDFREIIENNPDAVILMRDNIIVYASSPLATYLQRDSSAELVGVKLSSLVASGAERLRELLKGEFSEPSCVIELRRKDGEHVLVDVAPPKTIDFEDAPATMLVARDVTASQEALNARLLVADRMSAAGTLAAGVAHEINNPLFYVSTNLSHLETLLDDPALQEPERRAEVAELLAEIKDGVKRVAVIVEDLDAVSRSGDGDERSTDPLLALRTAVKMVNNQLRHRTELISNLAAVPKVIANDGKLVQVFLNVLMNAAQAIDSADSAKNKLEISTRRVGETAVIEIRDTGCGMSDETRKRVFDPFFTTKPPGNGTGLGMFFCHSVVTAIGGQIEIDSKVGVGTCVRILLPASSTSSGAFVPIRAKAAEAKEPVASLSVLIVDDEPFVGKAIARVLSSYDVTVTSCGEDAIEAFKKDRHDLVLCDIMMPGISGPQVYEQLLQLDPGVAERVMFMTGGAFTPKARAFASTLQDRVLKKPVAVDVLLDLAEIVATKKAGSLGEGS